MSTFSPQEQERISKGITTQELEKMFSNKNRMINIINNLRCQNIYNQNRIIKIYILKNVKILKKKK